MLVGVPAAGGHLLVNLGSWPDHVLSGVGLGGGLPCWRRLELLVESLGVGSGVAQPGAAELDG